MNPESASTLPRTDPDTSYAVPTLTATPSRVARFLWAVGTGVSIRTILHRHGYRKVDHEEGWELLRAACSDPDAPWPEELDPNAQDALIELDAWDERGFAIVTATLSHKHPAQARFLLTGIGPSEGYAAIAGVRTLLDRIDALEHGATDAPQDDARAVTALARRGLGKRERARLRELTLAAETARPAPASRALTVGDPRFERLVALRAWYDEWSEIARATVGRADHLVKLGLAGERPAPRSPEPADR